MGLYKKYSDKLYLKQWSLGFAKADLAELIRNKHSTLTIEWLTPEDEMDSWADPFIFKTDDGQTHVLYEKVNSYGLNGKITLLSLDKQLKPVSHKLVLETEAHLSYPFVYKENGKIYVFPENAFSGALYCYEFDQATQTLINKKEVINKPVVDATIIKHEGKYWMFCSMIGEARNSDLHIYYADRLTGPYIAHAYNPVKKDKYSARPAGSLVNVDGILYRPAQNCTSIYGESITINKIKKLTATEFAEEQYMTIYANKNDRFNYGIHTINACGDTIIVDGQKKYFQPVQQLTRKLKKFL
jgi:hypothetical protein